MKQPSSLSITILGRGCVVLFAVSTLFPVAAGVAGPGAAPRWLGPADVVVAAALCVAAMGVGWASGPAATDRDRAAAHRATLRVFYVVPALLAAFLVLGDRIAWDVLVVGLAWRGWLFVYVLPSLVAALGGRAAV